MTTRGRTPGSHAGAMVGASGEFAEPDGLPVQGSVSSPPTSLRAEFVAVNHDFAAGGGSSDSSGNSVPTLRDITLRIVDQEFVSIIGPSGCGKTTLLNMIAGLVSPSDGVVRLDGQVVEGPQAGRLSYMFARDGLLPWRTAVANVSLAMEMSRGRPSKARAAELLETVGLKGFESHYPSQLSQGMRQRVALARTLAVDSHMWLMDEPFAALDAHTRTLVQSEFSRIWEQTKKTALLVTHDLSEAIILSDRVIVMSARPGRIKSVYAIDLPRPRSVVDLQSNPAYVEIYRRLWADLRDEFASRDV